MLDGRTRTIDYFVLYERHKQPKEDLTAVQTEEQPWSDS
jgi:hypothetical protein